MFDKSELDKYDIQGMYKVYDKWPDIAHEFYQKKIECVNYENIDHIAFAGMGGSGTIGDIFSSILSKENIHVSVIKGYLLPKTVDENTLVVITSVSGDTAETLTILENATKNNIKTISFSSGGEIEKYCKKNNLKFFKIPKYHSPRASLIPFLYAILNILNSLLPIKKNEILESISQLEQTKENIFSQNLTKNNISLSLAEWIKDIPVIYYPFGLQSAAIRFKNSLQENAKIHVFAEDVIETSHNGIVSYEKKSIVKPILIEGADDYFKTKQRWSVIKEFFDENEIGYREIFSVKGGILSKLINLIYLLDYASIYLAILRKIDPTPVKSIDFIKKKMDENSNFLE
jgi:glucose/mannose-6-phosphate isomerase